MDGTDQPQRGVGDIVYGGQRQQGDAVGAIERRLHADISEEKNLDDLKEGVT